MVRKTLLAVGGMCTLLLSCMLFHSMMFVQAMGWGPFTFYQLLALIVVGGVQAYFWYRLGRTGDNRAKKQTER